ncbi:MAG TPA: MerR family transcriptional regulator [Pyrinomonadaceae bacterium]|nr:MerR family transcriptional regulator [Pyrinomonadaceae bacterium]
MSNSSHLTTKEVARICHVSDATVKRWEDSGMLRSERTGGGHRRFRAEEVARFQRLQGIGLNKCKNDEAVLRTVNLHRETQNSSESPLFNALASGCEEQASNLIMGEYLKGTPLTEIFDNIICEALNRIGELWYEGELTITQEHLASRIVHNAVHKLRLTISVPEPDGRLALCCTAEGDLHDLPAYLAQIILENAGWEVVNFGANTPLYCLSDEVLKYKPQLVCITSKVNADTERFLREYKMFREQTKKQNISIVLGGQTFRNSRFKDQFDAELIGESFAEFESFIKNLAVKS